MSEKNSEKTPLLNKEKEKEKEKSNYLAVPETNETEDVMSLYNENDILFFVKEDKKGNTTKDRIGHMLHTTNWNITILLMLACDVFIVVLELFVQLDEKKSDNNNMDKNKEMFVSVVHHLGYVSDVFLCVFTLEVLLHLYCFGFKYLFEAWINFIDSVTVITTFIVTVAIAFYAVNEKAQGLVDLLIILRFWRIFCLVESVVNATQLEANLRFKEVLIDLNAEVRILENRKNCYAEKLTELGYDLSKLENDYLFPKLRKNKTKAIENNDVILNVPTSIETNKTK